MSAHQPLPRDSGVKNNRSAEADTLPDANEILETLIGPVLVKSPVIYSSRGAVEFDHVFSVWNWLVRDIDPGLLASAGPAFAPEATAQSRTAFALKIAELIARSRKTVEQDDEADRRMRVQMGGDEVYSHLDQIECAFRNQQLLPKAVAFGRAINGVNDEDALKLALVAFPVNEPAVSSLMMHAAIGPVKNPHRLISVILNIADTKTQEGIERTGMAPIVDAMIAHAQNQLCMFENSYGKFADIDLACTALDRFHRLMVAVSIITENDRSCPWAQKISGLIREISKMIEPRLARLDSDIRVSLRKPRAGADRIDPDLLLEALNGLYLLAAVKVARESLALNSMVSTLWASTGKDLETLMSRNLDAYRKEPGNEVLFERLNAGIKMAEVRFNPEYADILKRARDAVRR